MQLALQQVIPIPLKDRIVKNRSGIWNETLSFNQGEYIFVQAPSGTGKTTLIHTLYGVRKDYEGTLYWDAYNMKAITSEQLSQVRSSYLSVIFQDMRLFPELTAWENLEIKRRLTNTVSEQEAEAWLQRLGMQEKKNSLASTLSYGEQQRIAIIRSLLQPFDWLLMDEPFSHLDKVNTSKAINLITEVVALHKAGMIIAELDENYYFPYTQTILL